MTTEALGAALSGLRVAQKSLDVTANNISNASTAGYTRKTLQQETFVAGDQAIGVRYGSVQRFVDQSLQRDYRAQLSADTYLNTTQSYLSRIVAIQGSTDAQTNISAQISALSSKFIGLSGQPDSAALQGNVVTQARTVASAFNNFSAQLNGMRSEVQNDIGHEVDSLNDSLKQIANLNNRIKTLQATGQSSADMEDKRDELVKSVAQQLDISYYTDGEGTMVLQTKQGQVLADSEARNISFDKSILNDTALYPDNVGGVYIDTNGAVKLDLAAITPGGKIGALLNLRDSAIPAYSAQMDELAYKMAVRFDDQGLRLFTDKTGTLPLNAPTLYAGFASKIQVNPLVINDHGLVQQGTSGAAINIASNDVIARVMNFTFGKYKDAAGTPNAAFQYTGLGANGSIKAPSQGDAQATLVDFGTNMLEGIAQDFNTAKSSYDSEHQYMQEVETKLLNTSAVDTDEEMAHMIELQKAYASSAKMISALDELFKDLLNSV